MNCGERRTDDGKRRFALIGVDLCQASPDDPQHVNVGGNELVVVDVTDPAAPVIVRAPRPRPAPTPSPASTSTDCRYAYSAGDSRRQLLDLRPAQPRQAAVEVDSNPAHGRASSRSRRPPPGTSGTSTPPASAPTPASTAPRCGTSSSRGTRGWSPPPAAAGAGNDPTVRGLQRLHPPQLLPAQRQERSGPGSRPSFANGNVLLVTEEDYEQTDCTKAGSFQTWHVKRLDGDRGRRSCRWTRSSSPTSATSRCPRGAFCSAHWFDYRPGGHRRGRLLRRRDPVHRRPRPPRHQVPRLRPLGRLRGLGRHVGAGLRRDRADQTGGKQQRRLLRSTWSAASTSTPSTSPATVAARTRTRPRRADSSVVGQTRTVRCRSAWSGARSPSSSPYAGGPAGSTDRPASWRPGPAGY